jgi:hypothetical protein
MIGDKMSAEEFRALVNSGAIIPTRRGLMTSSPDHSQQISKIKDLMDHKKKMQKQNEVNQRYLAKKDPSRARKKRSVKVVGMIDTNLIERNVKKWGAKKAIFIPYDVASLKNSKQIVPYLDKDGEARFAIIPSKASQTYKRLSSPYWISARELFLQKIAGKKFPLVIGFFFIRKRDAIFDYHNMIQFPMDMMRDFGWLPDDSCIYAIGFPMGHMVESKCPGLVITVFPLQDTIPFYAHPYDKLGYPDTYSVQPSTETLALWGGMKKLVPDLDPEFYEEERPSELELDIDSNSIIVGLNEFEDDSEEEEDLS